MFENVFGPVEKRRKSVCAFGFEANPMHVARSLEVQKCYVSRGWRTKFIVPRAVSDKDNQALEFLVSRNATNADGGGSGLNFTRTDGWDKIGSVAKKVMTLDLLKWLERHIFERKLPPGYGYKASQQKPVVLMKMDIEGAEYRVLPRLVMHAALCKGKIDLIYFEEHERLVPLVPDRFKLDGKVMDFKLANKIQALDSDCDPAELLSLDDETYSHDHTDDDQGWRSDDPTVYKDDLCSVSDSLSKNFKCVNSWWCPTLADS